MEDLTNFTITRRADVLVDNQAYALHIHEFPVNGHDCSTAGEHFNPSNQNHGGRLATERHVGDLGNIRF